MENLWCDLEAERFADDAVLGLRVYTSQLQGRSPDLVLHGGGNTSVKGDWQNIFGDIEKVLYVKGSGWDLRTIKAAGFAPVKLDYLQRLGALSALTDSQMMQHLRSALLDPTAPTPSVEAILHALIPHAYVDHTHADAVVAISNSPQGEEVLREIYGDRVLILPYIMPGFMLAQQVHQATQALDWQSLQGIILLHHGIFTFAEDAKTSYDTMIALVSKAEDYLDQSGARSSIVAGDYQPTSSPAPQTSTQQPGINDHLTLARLRAQASKSIGYPLLLRWQYDPLSVGFSKLDSVAELVSRGPLTPDHSIHTKPFAAVFSADPGPGLQQFSDDYLNYFNQHAQAHHQCLDLLPRVGVWRDRGMVYLAPTVKRLDIVADIYRHTLQAIQWGEALGGWTALPHQDLFDLEYWELEQAKLKTSQQRQPFEGRVVLVTGAASGIGKACVEAFVKVGACVVALDIDSKITAMFAQPQVSGQLCDVTDSAAVQLVIAQTIERFGGLDVLVSNAGFFPRSQTLEFISDEAWEKSLTLNLGAHMRLLRSSIPFLRHGLDPSVVIVGSKNVPAPGPGAAAYSAAKAGLAQLARVAALELAGDGIRVNTIHPDAVFDTALWTAETLAARAASYGISVAEYKNKNLLRTAVSSADVAAMAVLLAGPGFAKTTGAQIAVDGGNERVI